jgi:tagatose 6-phosphate kinase
LIVAAGLTPAWQQIMRFDGLRPGEVNRAIDVHWCASGKILNVAVALAHLGAPAETIALVGGATGEQIDREFTRLGISRRWIETHYATRICTTLIDRRTARVTELVENAGPVTHGELEQFRSVYAERVADAQCVILTGSLPAGAPRTFFRELLLATPCPAILDIRGEELITALECRPFLVKPNRDELAQTLGRELSTDAQLRGAMRELEDRGAQRVVVSQGAGPVWASGQGQFLRISTPEVAVVNPIGSGDCLAAGLAWGVSEGKQPRDALRLAVAAAVENVTQLLPARLDPELVRARSGTILVESV